jgi:hypothetical protein
MFDLTPGWVDDFGWLFDKKIAGLRMLFSGGFTGFF